MLCYVSLQLVGPPATADVTTHVSPLKTVSLVSITQSAYLVAQLFRLEEEQARHEIRGDYDPRLLALTIASLAGFPFLLLPLVGEHLGLQLDDDLPDRLIAHNQKFLSHALRARSEESR